MTGSGTNRVGLPADSSVRHPRLCRLDQSQVNFKGAARSLYSVLSLEIERAGGRRAGLREPSGSTFGAVHRHSSNLGFSSGGLDQPERGFRTPVYAVDE